MRTVPLSYFQRKGHMPVTDCAELDVGEDNETHNAKKIQSPKFAGLGWPLAIHLPDSIEPMTALVALQS